VTGFYPTPKISTITRVREAADRTADISILIESFGVALILLCTIDLGLSFLYVWNRKRSGHNIIVVITAALAFALAALALAVFGENERYWTTIYEPKVNGSELLIEVYDGDQKAAKYGRVLMCAFSIAVFVFSLVAAAFTVFVFMVSPSKAILQRVSLSLYTSTGALKLTEIPF
jgi:carbon starvation protein CstA